MSLEEPKFLEFIKECFKKNNSYFDKILSSQERKDKLLEYSHFYYFICEPDKQETREELRLIGITSLMDAMMQKEGQIKRGDSAKRVREYLNKYVVEEDKRILLQNIEKHCCSKEDEKRLEELLLKQKKIVNNDNSQELKIIQNEIDQIKIFCPLKDIDEFAKLLYGMRSEFVHEAKMHNFCPSECFASLGIVNRKKYDIRINISQILEIFEKSFIKYWSEGGNYKLAQ